MKAIQEIGKLRDGNFIDHILLFFFFLFSFFFSLQPKDNRCSLQLGLISEIETPLLLPLSAANEFAHFYRRSRHAIQRA